MATRQFEADSRFFRGLVLKTPFRGDVARVYFRSDNRVVVQHLGKSKPIGVTSDTPVTTAIALASEALDNWDN